MSGLDAGPFPDGTPDQSDDDGDGFCDLSQAQLAAGLKCLTTTAPAGSYPNGLLGGDCDDTPTGRANHPGAAEWLGDHFDNPCDGFVVGD